MTRHLTISSPVGPLTLAERDGALVRIAFGGGGCGEGREVREGVEGVEGRDCCDRSPLLDEAARQLADYFAGRRRDFDLPLAPAGTAFQQAVWAALRSIPYGQTRSYKDIAAAVGRPRACRAVGMANNRNPLPIVIPCHRVIGASGALTGYAGGVEIKHTLLQLENCF